MERTGGPEPTNGIAGLPEYPIERPPERRGPRVRPGRAWAGAAVVLVLLGGYLITRAGTRGGGRTDGTNQVIPDPIGLGSPIDGKSSLRLPVRVFPDHDLVEGQAVTVIAAGFRPNVNVGAVICTTAAQVQGAAACDIGQVVAIGTTDRTGRVTIPYTVRRFASIGGQQFDCMQGNISPPQYEDRLQRGLIAGAPDLSWVSCLLVVGQVDDYDQSGGWPFALQGQTFRDMPEVVETTVPPPTAVPTSATTVPPGEPLPDPTTVAPTPTVPATDAPATTVPVPDVPVTDVPVTDGTATTAPGTTG